MAKDDRAEPGEVETMPRSNSASKPNSRVEQGMCSPIALCSPGIYKVSLLAGRIGPMDCA